MNISYIFLNAYKWQKRFFKLFFFNPCLCVGAHLCGGTKTTASQLPATFFEIGLLLAWNLQLASLAGQRASQICLSPPLQQGNCQGMPLDTAFSGWGGCSD